jgi:hypothetical protein
MSAAGARRDAAICEEMSEHSYYKAQCVASAGGRAAQATPQASPQASPKAVT